MERKRKMNKKAIFFDIDGTLLDHDKALPASTKQAVMQLKEDGHFVGIATGRAPFMFESLRKELGIETFISFNGQYVVHEGTPIVRNALDQGELEQLIGFAREQQHPLVYMDHEGMRANTEEHQDIHAALNSLKFEHPSQDRDYYRKKPLYQTLLFCREGEEDAYKDTFPAFDFIRWHDVSTDILPAKGSKAKGIDAMVKQMGLDPEDVYVFGDGPNDVEMIQASKHGIAMGNSVPETKAVADFVTKDVSEDGVLHGLRHVGLLK
ncbi:Cof-like hydrolase [[Bacillus] selenitireducens MLS10]|uniref:Cof-like hydrolase n=2 Tax=Salisediminibacterium selenitireducens TaxID=85683 RepID=D6Y1F9_BACIE|nr:Cof-like hydrolase [[Bacillus] selenitireducens MLS10]